MAKRATPRHEALERLLSVAAELGVQGPAALANALNESDQTITNWGGARGVSKAGAMKAQDRFGCSANWVLNGTPPRMINEGAEPVAKTEEPHALYKLPTNSQRVMAAIMDLHAALASVDKHTRTAAAALLSGIADNVEDMDYVERQAGKLVELLDPPAPSKRAVAAG